VRVALSLLRYAIAALVVCAATAARAEEPRDYDAPDPDRNLVTYLRAVAGVGVVNWAVWQIDWALDTDPTYRITGRDVLQHPLSGFPFDEDTLNANFFGHPYGGALYFGVARSAGLSFWESCPFTLGGSLMWELLSESQNPAANDLVATTLGGIALGEILHRLSTRVLDDSSTGVGRFAREAFAFGISPARGVDRLETAQAWSAGPPPLLKPARIVMHAGVDSITAGSVTDTAHYQPGVVLGLDVAYGDLLPAPGKTTIAPYDFFDFYGGVVLSAQETHGFAVRSLGMLHGWSSDLSSSDQGSSRDNNVLGLVQTGDYEGSDAVEFAGFGLGVADFVALRSRRGARLRVGLDGEWVPVAAVVSDVTPFVRLANVVRNYNFSMGASIGLTLRWDMGPLGELGLIARQYGTEVINGIRGTELFGYSRGWYEVDAVRNLLGVGVAAKFAELRGTYAGARSDTSTQLSLQLYATLHL
jgi:hypothetical protein